MTVQEREIPRGLLRGGVPVAFLPYAERSVLAQQVYGRRSWIAPPSRACNVSRACRTWDR